MAVAYKVWDTQRTIRKVIMADSYHQLCLKAREKLSISSTVPVTIVLERDGTEIEDSDALHFMREETLMVVATGSEWRPLMPEITIQMPAATDDLVPTPKKDVHHENIEAENVEPEPEFRYHENVQPENTRAITLPIFSDYVAGRLEAGDSMSVWVQVIQEAAYHYLHTQSSLGLDNSGRMYRTIGSMMCQKYSCLARDGPHPWSFFTKGLSQKVRRIRHGRKKRPSVDAMDGYNAKKRDVGPKIMPKNLTQGAYDAESGDYDSHIKEIDLEMKKRDPNSTHINTLLTASFKQRREFISTLPPGSVDPIMEKFPCFKDPRFVMTEFKLILKESDLSGMTKRMAECLEAVKKLMKKEKKETSEDDLAVVMYIESKTGFKQGKGLKSQSVVTSIELTDGGDIAGQLASPVGSAPKLLQIQSEGVTKNYAVVFDTNYILLNTTECAKAILYVMAVYYITDLDYPRIYSQFLGLIQQFILREPFNGKKSALYVQFMKKLEDCMDIL